MKSNLNENYQVLTPLFAVKTVDSSEFFSLFVIRISYLNSDLIRFGNDLNSVPFLLPLKWTLYGNSM